MEAIDFISKGIYSKEPGNVDDVRSHPKFVLIRPDGVILYSDTDNDDKRILIHGKETICTHHEHYIAKLLENYFPEKVRLAEQVEQGNIYSPIFEFLNEGNILFNNITTYEGPTFFLHGIHGQLLIPENPTDNQKEALTQLDPYVNYFKMIEVKEYQDVERNIKTTSFEDGEVAIKNYLDRQQEHGKTRH